MKTYLSLFAFLIFMCTKVLSQVNDDRKQNFDNNWKFFLGDNADAAKENF